MSAVNLPPKAPVKATSDPGASMTRRLKEVEERLRRKEQACNIAAERAAQEVRSFGKSASDSKTKLSVKTFQEDEDAED